MKIRVMTDVLETNDRIAADNREIFDRNGNLAHGALAKEA